MSADGRSTIAARQPVFPPRASKRAGRRQSSWQGRHPRCHRRDVGWLSREPEKHSSQRGHSFTSHPCVPRTASPHRAKVREAIARNTPENWILTIPLMASTLQHRTSEGNGRNDAEAPARPLRREKPKRRTDEGNRGEEPGSCPPQESGPQSQLAASGSPTLRTPASGPPGPFPRAPRRRRFPHAASNFFLRAGRPGSLNGRSC